VRKRKLAERAFLKKAFVGMKLLICYKKAMYKPYKIAVFLFFAAVLVCVAQFLSGKFSLFLNTAFVNEAASSSVESVKTVLSLDQSETLRSKRFNLKFDTYPKKTAYEIMFSDGSVKAGQTPFNEIVSGGSAAVTFSYDGYNKLDQDISVDRDIDKFIYLDKSGQLVHHIRNITQVPSPKGIAFSPDGKELWVAMLLNKKRGLSVYDVESGNDLADIDLESGGGVELVFSKDGSRVYASQMETAKVFEIDAKTKKVLRSFGTQSAWTKVVELSPDGKTLYASNWSGNDVSAIDLESGRVRRYPAVKTPRGIFLTNDGKTMYVAGYGNGEIEKIDLATGLGSVIFKTGGAMRHIVADEARGVFFVSDMAKNAIFKVKLKDDTVVKFVDTDFDPNTIALSPDKKILFVSCRGRNNPDGNYYIPGPEWGSVQLFDAASGKMLDAIVGGNQPTALSVSGDGSLMAFSDFLDSRIEIFSVPDYETLKKGGGGRSAVYKSELWKK
jgi:DNA-binding beta-propeller fold protein YncE